VKKQRQVLFAETTQPQKKVSLGLLAQRLDLGAALFLHYIDLGTDLWIVRNWYDSDECKNCTWAAFGFVFILAPWLLNLIHALFARKYFLAAVHFVGLSPVKHVYDEWNNEKKYNTLQIKYPNMASLRFIDGLVESLPQSILQSYVVLISGTIDSFLVFSVVMSTFSVAYTLYAARQSKRYGIFRERKSTPIMSGILLFGFGVAEVGVVISTLSMLCATIRYYIFIVIPAQFCIMVPLLVREKAPTGQSLRQQLHGKNWLAVPTLMLVNYFAVFNSRSEYLRIRCHAIFWIFLLLQGCFVVIAFNIEPVNVDNQSRGGLCMDFDHRNCPRKRYNLTYLVINIAGMVFKALGWELLFARQWGFKDRHINDWYRRRKYGFGRDCLYTSSVGYFKPRSRVGKSALGGAVFNMTLEFSSDVMSLHSSSNYSSSVDRSNDVSYFDSDDSRNHDYQYNHTNFEQDDVEYDEYKEQYNYEADDEYEFGYEPEMYTEITQGAAYEYSDDANFTEQYSDDEESMVVGMIDDGDNLPVAKATYNYKDDPYAAVASHQIYLNRRTQPNLENDSDGEIHIHNNSVYFPRLPSSDFSSSHPKRNSDVQNVLEDEISLKMNQSIQRQVTFIKKQRSMIFDNTSLNQEERSIKRPKNANLGFLKRHRQSNQASCSGPNFPKFPSMEFDPHFSKKLLHAGLNFPSPPMIDDSTDFEAFYSSSESLEEMTVSYAEVRPTYEVLNTYFPPIPPTDPILTVQSVPGVTLNATIPHLIHSPDLLEERDYKSNFVSFRFQKPEKFPPDTEQKDMSSAVQNLLFGAELRERALMSPERARVTSANGIIANAEMDHMHREGTAERVRYILEQASLKNVHATFRDWW